MDIISYESSEDLTKILIEYIKPTEYRYNPSTNLGILVCDGLNSIPGGMFMNLNITSIQLPSSITSIGESAFANTQLTSITIPENVTYIDDNAFGDCTSVLENGTINILATTPPSIGEKGIPFGEIKSLTIYVPASAIDTYMKDEFWGSEIFKYLPYVSEYNTIVYNSKEQQNVIENFGENYIYAHTFNDGKGTLIFYNDLTEIYEKAFSECDITKIELPYTLTFLDNNVFVNNSLENIVIPYSVTSIGCNIFNEQLSSIQMLGINPPIMTENLGISDECIIYVPSCALTAYQEAEGWCQYTEQIQEF